jgi:hypothetical protein
VALIRLQEHLRIERCPHCGVDKPNLAKLWEAWTTNSENTNKRIWRFYVCARCGGVTTAFSEQPENYTKGIFPYDEGKRSGDIPAKPRAFLEQAVASIHAPAGAVMLAASSVDAMLKEKGLVEGTLYARIDQAATSGIITGGMAKWAHQVRLDANDQRHADVKAGLPSEQDARRSIQFVEALAEFLFVLPAMVEAGLKDSGGEKAK